MRIVSLTEKDSDLLEQTASLLYHSFKTNWPAGWPDMEAARIEVRESLPAERISRVALDEKDHVIGWIGGQFIYDGNVCEVHPLAVDQKHRGQGVGRALINDLEEVAGSRGAVTLWLGTDDENAMTSLSGVNLYENLFEQLKNIKDFKGHPFAFYQKVGFQIVGVLPDANGVGKPDIYMAKPIGCR